MPGLVITFYSYKGGVGRSFALANIGVVLAQWGARVLLVDWDVEAPGLAHYFAAHSPKPKAGVLDFLHDCQKDAPRPWNEYAVSFGLPGARHAIHLMPAAGDESEDYTRCVQDLDWDLLYDTHDLGSRLEALRAEWVSEFDMVLVDSRTGVTSFSGLATAQLPDILAFMFTANEQSLSGCADVARRAMAARRRMSIDRPALIPLPIPARFDQRDEFERARLWRARFASDLKPFFDWWAPAETDVPSLVDRLTIPYMARWTFGEDLAAKEEPAGTSGTRTSSQIVTYALETIAATLVQRLTDVPLLVSSRDEYVLTARNTVRSWGKSPHRPFVVYLSHAHGDEASVRKIANELTSAGFAPHFIGEQTSVGERREAHIYDWLNRADAYLVIFGISTLSMSIFQHREITLMQRVGLRSQSARRPIIPVVLPHGLDAFAKSALIDYKEVFIDPSPKTIRTQLQTVFKRLNFARRGSGSVDMSD